MLVLGWFTIPAEVFLRRDFGQRWFTTINFYAGLFLLLIISVLQYVFNIVWDAVTGFIADIKSALDPSYQAPEPSLTDRVIDKSMLFFLMAYLLMGIYHLFKIWWRNRTNSALHSFDDGTSRIQPIARYLVEPLNIAMKPLLWVGMWLLPGKQLTLKSPPQFITDPSVMTNTVLEPLLLLILAWKLHGITSLWLFLTAIAVAIHANWKETARLNKVLDFRDSIMEAKVMAELKEGVLHPKAQSRIMQQAAATIRENPQVVPQVTQQYPNLMSIIEDLNMEGSHLSV